MEKQLLAIILVSLGALCWAVRDLVSKDMRSPSVFLTLAATNCGGLMINTVVMAWKQCAGFGCTDPLSKTTQLWLLARATGAAMGVTFNFMALKRLDLALSTMIHCSSPLLVVLLGHVLLGEHIKPMAIVCIAVAIGGMVLDIQPWRPREGGGGSLAGFTYAFAGAVASAFSYTSLRALHALDSTTTLFTMYVSCLAIGFFVCLFEGIPHLEPRVLYHFAALSVVTYVAEVFITKGYALATKGAGSVAVYKFLTPAFSIVFDMIFFHKIPNFLSVVGALLVIGASVLMLKVNTAGNDPKDMEDESTDEDDANSDEDEPNRNLSANQNLEAE